MMSAPKRDKRSLLDGVSWADVKEDVKKQEVDAKEQEERIKEAQRLLEERAAVIPLPEPLEVTKKEFEEFFNADWNEDTNDNGFAGQDGLMLDPLEILKQCQVRLDDKELEEAQKEKEKREEEAKKEKKKREKEKKRQRGRRGND